MGDNDLLQTLSGETVKRSLQETFDKHLKKLLGLIGMSGGKAADDVFLSQCESDEERALVRELCDEIDDYHANQRRLAEAMSDNPSLTEGEWLEEQLLAEANQLAQHLGQRDLTGDEREALVDELQQSLMAEAESEGELLDKQLDGMKKEMEDKR